MHHNNLYLAYDDIINVLLAINKSFKRKSVNNTFTNYKRAYIESGASEIFYVLAHFEMKIRFCEPFWGAKI